MDESRNARSTGTRLLIPFGVGLAYVRDRTRSVIPGMVVHALFNGAALAFAVVS